MAKTKKQTKAKTIPVTIDYACDWSSKSGDDQQGHIIVTTKTGQIEGTWSCSGGMGDGSDLISNTTHEFTDEEAGSLLDTNDLCQGIGTYRADIGEDKYGWYTVENVVWVEDTSFDFYLLRWTDERGGWCDGSSGVGVNPDSAKQYKTELWAKKAIRGLPLEVVKFTATEVKAKETTTIKAKS